MVEAIEMNKDKVDSDHEEEDEQMLDKQMFYKINNKDNGKR